MSKLIQKYQGIDKYLLSKFLKVIVLNGTDVVQVTSWGVINFPSFNSLKDYPNEYEWRGLVQKKETKLNYIFGTFDLILWRDSIESKVSYKYSFEKVRDHSKNPLIMSGDIFQLKTKSESNIPGCTKKSKRSPTKYEYYECKGNCVY